jgi:peptidase M28-like protein
MSAVSLRALVEALCSDRCAGRAPGTPGGEAGREIIAEAFAAAGLTAREQPVPGCDGANLIAAIPAAGRSEEATERWVLLAAHHDHLGRHGRSTYWGADDNASAIAVLIAVAGALARERPQRRGVLVAAFDSEEPPYFLSDAMGSEWYAAHAPVPLDHIDMMLCMDIVGHALGDERFPPEVRNSIFALGAERSAGTAAHLDTLSTAEPGLWVRRLDAEIIPPLSDYDAFWNRRVPFLFLTCGRSRHYHTPEDTPDKLDYEKMAALARWLERWTRETCARPEARVTFDNRRDDASTLRTMAAVLRSIERLSPQATSGREMAEVLLAKCDAHGRLGAADRREASELMLRLEAGLE